MIRWHEPNVKMKSNESRSHAYGFRCNDFTIIFFIQLLIYASEFIEKQQNLFGTLTDDERRACVATNPSAQHEPRPQSSR